MINEITQPIPLISSFNSSTTGNIKLSYPKMIKGKECAKVEKETTEEKE